MAFRKGQWVTTSTEIPGAATTPEGRAIGVYVSRHVPLAPEGVEPVEVPEHIAFARPDGTNLMRLSDDGNSAVRVAVALGDLEDVRPLIEADHIPGDRGMHLGAGAKLDA